MLEEAHKRELRVITELVINHTSDQHPWFQAARNAPAGSPERDFYVWSDTDQLYQGTRIIFTDTEKSNWTWDPVAKAYYWHRFFSHQPDLNFDNPEVLEAVFRIMRFWLDMGVDGFRLDAIPYLIERDGTSNENLPETHDVIKKLRAAIDANYENRFLLAEANMWPEDVREYFGEGDECHMAYHFPLMPRMYMAIAQEDRDPIVEIMQQTPDIPDGCQWAIFLRNHDELTLEMVTNRERDYMYTTYAADMQARINLGIRRRLAPLMENDKDAHQAHERHAAVDAGLAHHLLRRRARHGRQRLRRRPQRRAHADAVEPRPQRRLLARRPAAPVPAAHHGRHVRLRGAQRRGAAARQELAAALDAPHAGGAQDQPRLRARAPHLPQARQPQDPGLCQRARRRRACCRSSTSRARRSRSSSTSRPTRPACRWRCWAAPPSRRSASCPTCSPCPRTASTGSAWPKRRRCRAGTRKAWACATGRCWCSSTAGPACSRTSVMPWRIGFADRLRQQFERDTLPPHIQAQRWYGYKGSVIGRAQLRDHAVFEADGKRWMLPLLELEGPPEPATYFMPLASPGKNSDEERTKCLQRAAIAKVRQQANVGLMGDAFFDEAFCRAIVQAILQGSSIDTAAWPPALPGDAPGAGARIPKTSTALPVSPPTALSSNTVVMLDETLFLKGYRQIRPGVNPELEMGRFLTEVAGFPHSVPVLGAIEYEAQDGSLDARWRLLQAYVPNQGDGWSYTLDYLERSPGRAARRGRRAQGRSARRLPGAGAHPGCSAPASCTTRWPCAPAIRTSTPSR